MRIDPTMVWTAPPALPPMRTRRLRAASLRTSRVRPRSLPGPALRCRPAHGSATGPMPRTSFRRHAKAFGSSTSTARHQPQGLASPIPDQHLHQLLYRKKQRELPSSPTQTPSRLAVAPGRLPRLGGGAAQCRELAPGLPLPDLTSAEAPASSLRTGACRLPGGRGGLLLGWADRREVMDTPPIGTVMSRLHEGAASCASCWLTTPSEQGRLRGEEK